MQLTATTTTIINRTLTDKDVKSKSNCNNNNNNKVNYHNKMKEENEEEQQQQQKLFKMLKVRTTPTTTTTTTPLTITKLKDMCDNEEDKLLHEINNNKIINLEKMKKVIDEEQDKESVMTRRISYRRRNNIQMEPENELLCHLKRRLLRPRRKSSSSSSRETVLSTTSQQQQQQQQQHQPMKAISTKTTTMTMPVSATLVKYDKQVQEKRLVVKHEQDEQLSDVAATLLKNPRRLKKGGTHDDDKQQCTAAEEVIKICLICRQKQQQQQQQEQLQLTATANNARKIVTTTCCCCYCYFCSSNNKALRRRRQHQQKQQNPQHYQHQQNLHKTQQQKLQDLQQIQLQHRQQELEQQQDLQHQHAQKLLQRHQHERHLQQQKQQDLQHLHSSQHFQHHLGNETEINQQMLRLKKCCCFYQDIDEDSGGGGEQRDQNEETHCKEVRGEELRCCREEGGNERDYDYGSSGDSDASNQCNVYKQGSYKQQQQQTIKSTTKSATTTADRTQAINVAQCDIKNKSSWNNNCNGLTTANTDDKSATSTANINNNNSITTLNTPTQTNMTSASNIATTFLQHNCHCCQVSSTRAEATLSESAPATTTTTQVSSYRRCCSAINSSSSCCCCLQTQRHQQNADDDEEEEQQQQQQPAHDSLYNNNSNNNHNNNNSNNFTAACVSTNDNNFNKTTSNNNQIHNNNIVATIETTASIHQSLALSEESNKNLSNICISNISNKKQRHHFYLNILQFFIIFIQLQVLPYCCNIFKRQQQQQEVDHQPQRQQQQNDNLIAAAFGSMMATIATPTTTTTRLNISRNNNYYNQQQQLQQHHTTNTMKSPIQQAKEIATSLTTTTTTTTSLLSTTSTTPRRGRSRQVEASTKTTSNTLTTSLSAMQQQQQHHHYNNNNKKKENEQQQQQRRMFKEKKAQKSIIKEEKHHHHHSEMYYHHHHHHSYEMPNNNYNNRNNIKTQKKNSTLFYYVVMLFITFLTTTSLPIINAQFATTTRSITSGVEENTLTWNHQQQEQLQQQYDRDHDEEQQFADALSMLRTHVEAAPLSPPPRVAASHMMKRMAVPARTVGSTSSSSSPAALTTADAVVPKKKEHMKLSRNETLCKSMDIRNDIDSFKQLQNCTAIEGFLLISLVNARNLTETYPLLTEVTEYIVVYRVVELYSLSQIFPNLRVIRGKSLFDGYALVVYSNRDLQDIGLAQLRAIANGGVRIEKNLSLCYVKTIDWKQIVSSNATDVVLKANREPKECPKCPGENKGSEAAQDGGGEGVEGVENLICRRHQGQRFCWSDKACQIICPDRCRNNCINETTCCHESCLGGCIDDGKKVQLCTSCRHYSIHNDTCIDKCPSDYYSYLDRRCITAETCERIGTKFEKTSDVPLVHYDGQCTTRCPKGYTKFNSTCQRCDDRCEKICEGGTIDSFERAKEFNGCTQIGHKGLTISIKRGGPHLMEALEYGFGQVHTIRTHLKVHLNFGLVSLSFFKSLKEIKGELLYESRFAFYVLENNDLQEIWAPNQTVELQNGSVFFHFNPKLCYSVIDALRPMLATKIDSFNKNEVAMDSNGNKGSCNTERLNTTVLNVMTQVALVRILNPIRYDDERTFIGYQYFVVEDPYRNATKHSYRPCDDNWSASDPVKETTHIIPNLEPYKQYAFYVKTMTISSETRNAESEINYFRTKPSKPQYVRQLKAVANSSSEIILNWNPPVHAYGNLTMYIVRAVLYNRNIRLESRNYCKDPLKETFSEKDEGYVSPSEKSGKLPSPEQLQPADCQCEKDEKKPSTVFDPTNEAARQDEIEFENTLQNFVYVKDPNRTSHPPISAETRAQIAQRRNNLALNAATGGAGGRGRPGGLGGAGAGGVAGLGDTGAVKKRRRSIETVEVNEGSSVTDGSFLTRHMRSLSEDQADVSDWNASSMAKWPPNTLNPKTSLNETRMSSKGDYYEIYVGIVNASTTQFRFTNLKHFSMYTLAVVACRETFEDDTQDTCSEVMLIDKITLKMDHVDRAENLDAVLENTNTSRSNVRLHWDPPQKPNGAVVSYTISYEKQDQDAVEEHRCITELDFQNLTNGYLLTNLPEGNFSIRVRANSLAGEGEYTERVYIEVPPTRISPGAIAAIVISCLLLVCISIAMCGYFVRKKSAPSDLTMFPTVNPFYISLQYIPDEWEVPRERVIQLSPLGQGSFGMVYEGILKGYHNSTEDTPCAIKTVNENATDRERMNFLNEASVMKQFDTYHVVRLLGVCSRGQPALVVMELMKNGDLKSYLRAHRPDDRDDGVENFPARALPTIVDGQVPQPPKLSRIYQMAIEIADGMAYLAAKKFVHRDLAARNCMVALDLTVKIGDFGMTRDIYETDYYRKGTKGLLPVRWMAPESLRDGVYASSSDVFSYGVVLWEMVTLASQPYQGLSNDQVLRYVIDGGVMERPENCPDRLYYLMQKCWHHRPSARPSFLEIINLLMDMSDPQFKEVSFYHSDDGQEALAKELLERNQHGADVYNDAEKENEDATTPLRIGEYQGYKSNAENNSSAENQGNSPKGVIGVGGAVVADTAVAAGGEGHTNSPYSLQSGFIVSSTPDRQSKSSYTNPVMSSAPSAGVPSAATAQQPRPYYSSGRAAAVQGDDDTAAYVLPDADALAAAYERQTTDERGYELYDPSPNYTKMSAFENTELDDMPTSGGKLSGEQHLIPRTRTARGKPTIMPMSSSVPDDAITTAPMSSSLHPSTASAASSNASSTAGTGVAAPTGRYPSLKRAMAETFMPSRLRNINRHFFNHKRSGSNTSHKSTASNPNAGPSSSNANLTSGASTSGAATSGYGKSVSGQNLGTIESGGSGSAGSYVGTPRFFTPATSKPGPTSSANISDNPNYKLLDESANVSGLSTAPLVTTTSKKSKPTSPAGNVGVGGAPGSSYTLLNESLNSSAATNPAATLTTSDNPNYEMMQPPSSSAGGLNASDNPNYVMMNEPSGPTTSAAAANISENPNYQMMGPGPSTASTSAVAPSSSTSKPSSNLSALSALNAALRREQSAERLDNSSTSSSAGSSDEEPDDMDDDDEHTEHIKMERMPLSSKARALWRGKQEKSAGAKQQRSRSASQNRNKPQETVTTPTSGSSTSGGGQQQQQQQQQEQQQPQSRTANTFSLKENWLRSQQPPRPPPPNGFIGREA